VNSPVIGSLLCSLRELQASLVRVKHLIALQQIYARAVPGHLAKKSRVAFEQSGAVVIVADTSAVATKLRQLAPRIVDKIVKSAPEVTSIQVEVQVTREGDAGARRLPRIGSRGRSSWSQLRDTLPPSPLRNAVVKLLQRGSESSDEHQPLHGEEREHDQ
jgi:Dna[CI] antecedent, DciA